MGEVLLIQRGKEPAIGTWTLPGGQMELGETILECARREMAEETGVTDFRLSRPFTSVDVIAAPQHQAGTSLDPAHVKFQFAIIELVGVVSPGSNPVVVAADDAADAQWVLVSSLGSTCNLETTNNLIEVIKHAHKLYRNDMLMWGEWPDPILFK
eukprot:GFYU01010826.1.p1 GENE.GFYU01010826.1~~GFYU01010826.1.p1  ORF type:complete len:155 (-),score=16.57 GFYU01010826.1:30-494(-)